MPNATFYTAFSKKPNSTKRPSGGTTYNCNIKSPCDYYHPTIELNNTANLRHATYFSMDGWYYYVTSAVYNPPVWEISGTLDPLATWKGDITGHRCMIVRCADSKNGLIADNLAIGEGVTNLSHTAVYNGSPLGVTGTYVVAIMGKNTTSYLCTVSTGAYNELLSNICDKTRYTDGDLPTDFNPLDYVYKSFFIPFIGFGGERVTTCGVGLYTCNLSAQVLTFPIGSTASRTQNFTHPIHPQTNTLGNWVNHSPFTNRVLHYPPFGDIPIDYPASATGLQTEVICDIVTGDSILNVYIDGIRIAQRITNIAVDMLISHSVTPSQGEYALNVAGDFFKITTDALHGNIGGAIDTIYNGAINFRDGGKGYTSTGSQGSFATFTIAPQYVNTFVPMVEPDYTNMGHPYMKTEMVGAHTGFLQCATANLDTSAPEPYKTEIQNTMKGGIFIE